MIVHFKSEEHKFLSNFYMVDVELDGKIYPSVEHAYMSAKSDEDVTIDDETRKWKDWCADRKMHPAEIKKRSYNLTLIPNWDKKKFHIMYKCVSRKFSKEPLRSKLLATGDQNIQEGNWHEDRIWGVDLKVNPNVGENYLGRILMKVRNEIKRQA